MSIIALFNAAKDYFEARRTNQVFRHLDDHYLKDIGFYRDNGHIRPISGASHDENELHQKNIIPPGEQPSDS
ncbi:hypothetical protein [Marinomonas posidonica]|uniref:DUF1127 domain-containing protein n=1 Tax=Marinomonas posidonica (strain CECT 7376 / NCIMB 14433 / IVIA-Po-181) TaxID=491952 RepID=F6CYJ3_MARPP|nr:hypothetical protein [Marinomonas posidonica]AEF54602.1 hypothetical protein Mar181_1561 [Marinomonas posidonica IVIA-Po-181]